MLAWRHAGFSAHNEVRVPAEDAEGRKKLAGYMLRAPMSPEQMTYDGATGMVIYRSKMHACAPQLSNRAFRRSFSRSGKPVVSRKSAGTFTLLGYSSC